MVRTVKILPCRAVASKMWQHQAAFVQTWDTALDVPFTLHTCLWTVPRFTGLLWNPALTWDCTNNSVWIRKLLPLIFALHFDSLSPTGDPPTVILFLSSFWIKKLISRFLSHQPNVLPDPTTLRRAYFKSSSTADMPKPPVCRAWQDVGQLGRFIGENSWESCNSSWLWLWVPWWIWGSELSERMLEGPVCTMQQESGHNRIWWRFLKIIQYEPL